MIDERTEKYVQRGGLVGALACFSLAGWLYLSPDATSDEPENDEPARQQMSSTRADESNEPLSASGMGEGREPSTDPAEDPVAPGDELLTIKSWTGDLDGMIERRLIRALVVHNPMQYFLDGATQRGTAYEGLKEFEKLVNERYGNGTLPIRMVFLPVSRDRLLPELLAGHGDIAAANLTITPERRQLVDFSDPFAGDVREVIVTATDVPPLKDVAELAGREIHVRESSSYHASLVRQNAKLREQGLEAIRIIAADELLEDADLLEMVNAGLIPMVVVDDHKALFWAGVFENLRVHEVAVSTGGEIGWAFRKDSPELEQLLNEFVAANKKGTLLGNIILKRYLKENKWVRNARGEAERKRFEETIGLFQKYAGEYDFDWLMLAALGYQESQLDQSVRSPAGAVGVMQMLPSTAADPNIGIPDIRGIDNNIHAGTKYLRFLRDRYFDDESISRRDRTLFSFASYNAGPARVAGLRKEAAQRGFDPDVWFDNVEIVAAERIGRETVQYVSNIYKYYVAYRLLVEHEDMKRKLTGSE